VVALISHYFAMELFGVVEGGAWSRRRRRAVNRLSSSRRCRHEALAAAAAAASHSHHRLVQLIRRLGEVKDAKCRRERVSVRAGPSTMASTPMFASSPLGR